MLGAGRETPGRGAARVDGHLLPFVEDLDHALGGLDFALPGGSGCAEPVEVLLKGDMVVDIDLARSSRWQTRRAFRAAGAARAGRVLRTTGGETCPGAP